MSLPEDNAASWLPASPWHWEDVDVTQTGAAPRPVLKDADGVILAITSGGVLWSPARGPYIRRLSAAAPKLLDLVRRYMDAMPGTRLPDAEAADIIRSIEGVSP